MAEARRSARLLDTSAPLAEDASAASESDPGALADAYADRHERLDNFIVMYAVPRTIFAHAGIDLLSARGFALLLVLFFLGILVPALLLTAVTSAWHEAPLIRTVAIAASLAALNVLALILAQAAAFKISALHRTLVDAAQIRSLTRWDRRWYSPHMSALMGGAIGLIYLAILYLMTLELTGIRLSAPTLWICAVVTTFLGQFSFSTTMIFFEFRAFMNCRFRLFSLSPIDTRALQVTGAGLRELGVVSIVLLPLFYLVLLSVLPEGSSLNLPITGGFLLLSYLATAVGILFPLAFLGAIVKAEKWRILEPLQDRLNGLATSISESNRDRYEEFTRLQALHAAIAGSRDSLLDVGAVLRIAGAVALSTLGVIASSLLQSYLDRLF